MPQPRLGCPVMMAAPSRVVVQNPIHFVVPLSQQITAAQFQHVLRFWYGRQVKGAHQKNWISHRILRRQFRHHRNRMTSAGELLQRNVRDIAGLEPETEINARLDRAYVTAQRRIPWPPFEFLQRRGKFGPFHNALTKPGRGRQRKCS